MKKTKIIATIGPASQDTAMMTKMVKAGMNIVRLNFSHGSYDNHSQLMATIRSVSKATDTSVGILQDLQGPKIRVGNLEQPIEIKTGSTVTIGKDFSMDFDISTSVKAGDRILIEDGLLELTVSKVNGKEIVCKVINGGMVQSHKGINIPDSVTTFPVMTEKDKRDLKFGLENDVDFVALSFVRNREDIDNIKSMIEKWLPRGKTAPLVVAKIEKPEAVTNFDEILEAADAIMVARGDLGVELPDHTVPVIQKDIVAKCNQAGKPVIVATQMLDSMIRNPRPTRAEVADIANAVIDGADCVMLSGESAFGKYPLESVAEMTAVIDDVEASGYVYGSEITHDMLHNSESSAIISRATNFESAALLSNTRPFVPIVMFAKAGSKLLRQLTILNGVIPVQDSGVGEDLAKAGIAFLKSMKMIEKGNEVIVVKDSSKAKSPKAIEVHQV
jgi:pyruvate kinase